MSCSLLSFPHDPVAKANVLAERVVQLDDPFSSPMMTEFVDATFEASRSGLVPLDALIPFITLSGDGYGILKRLGRHIKDKSRPGQPPLCVIAGRYLRQAGHPPRSAAMGAIDHLCKTLENSPGVSRLRLLAAQKDLHLACILATASPEHLGCLSTHNFLWRVAMATILQHLPVEVRRTALSRAGVSESIAERIGYLCDRGLPDQRPSLAAVVEAIEFGKHNLSRRDVHAVAEASIVSDARALRVAGFLNGGDNPKRVTPVAAVGCAFFPPAHRQADLVNDFFGPDAVNQEKS